MPPVVPRPGTRFALALVLVFAAAAGWLVPALQAARSTTLQVRDRAYIDAREFGRRHGLAATWIEPGRRLRLQSRWTRLELEEHATTALLNGTALMLSDPVVAHRTSLYLSRGDADRLLTPILVPPARPPGPVRTVVIDPGHGGVDPGHRHPRFKVNEKVYTLDVAKRLERLLKESGFRVVLTRRDDRFLSLEQRTKIAARAKADVFISIHFNGFSDPTVAGVETFVMTPVGHRSTPQRERDPRMAHTRFDANAHDAWNPLLGYHVHQQLAKGLGTADRGLKRFRYHVLRNAPCPAVLVEAAFLSNDTEARKMATAAHRQKIAAQIAAGISRYAATVAKRK